MSKASNMLNDDESQTQTSRTAEHSVLIDHDDLFQQVEQGGLDIDNDETKLFANHNNKSPASSDIIAYSTSSSSSSSSSSNSSNASNPKIEKFEKSSSSSDSDSASSIIATLSILSFSNTPNSSSASSSYSSLSAHHNSNGEDDASSLLQNRTHFLHRSTMPPPFKNHYMTKKFYGKEWLFKKLAHYMRTKQIINENYKNNNNNETALVKESANNSNILILVGDSGTGKTHLCCELNNRKTLNPDALYIRQNHLVTTYFFTYYDLAQNQIRKFYNDLSRALSDKFQLNYDKEIEEEEEEYENLGIEHYCEKFNKDILKKLHNFNISSNFFILIDGLDDALLLSERLNDKSQQENFDYCLKFIKKSLCNFPKWLNLCFTCRRVTEKLHIRPRLNLMSNNYDRIQLDKRYHISGVHQQQQQQQHAHSSEINLANLKDIQTFILKNLESTPNLKAKFSHAPKGSSIELINLLLLKSNYSILYVEKIFDLIRVDFLNINEINQIPVTLNGLYLYIIDKIILKFNKEFDDSCMNDNAKSFLYCLFGVLIIESKSFSIKSLHEKLSSRFVTLEMKQFQMIFEFLAPFFFIRFDDSHDESMILFHSSFIDWFTDVKFSTKKYFNDLSDAHYTLAYHFYNQIQLDKNNYELKSKFEHHFRECKKEDNELLLTYYKSLNDNEGKKSHENQQINQISLDTLDRKIQECEQIVLDFDSFEVNQDNNNNNQKESCETILEFITKNDLQGLKEDMQKIKNNGEVLLSNLLSQYRDSLDQTVLLVCVKLNNYEMFKFLIEKISKKNRKIIINFNHCDSSGWSMLRYSAWIGNEDIVKCCLENGALVDACDNEGRTALRAAVFSGHDNIAKILIKYGANGKFFWFFTRLFLLCKPRECISR
jgi:hypothetical protein